MVGDDDSEVHFRVSEAVGAPLVLLDEAYRLHEGRLRLGEALLVLEAATQNREGHSHEPARPLGAVECRDGLSAHLLGAFGVPREPYGLTVVHERSTGLVVGNAQFLEFGQRLGVGSVRSLPLPLFGVVQGTVLQVVRDG